MIHLPKKICLSCRNFSLQDPQSGVCKVVKGLVNYPLKATGDTCGQWRDCGQQYFIRTGWIKGRLAKENGDKVATESGIIC
ncbi:MAG: hypothetical protein KJ990_04480 [Proteobacteria bacterium]|nr:hypothetical protein [Pseudomonadota bacterium]MBU1649955.1 hypothetical protein [Pseudomonadota bacterium]